MNNTVKNKVRKQPKQTLTLNKQNNTDGFSVRLAEGESWNGRSVELAIMVVQETYLDKLHVPHTDADVGFRMNQVTIRRNSFTPDYEPSRHEMRIFDAMDGVVTEM